MPFTEVLGLGLSIGGSFAYSFVRMQEMDQKAREKDRDVVLPVPSSPAAEEHTESARVEEGIPTKVEPANGELPSSNQSAARDN